ncbi:hypothetical protein HYY71_03260 [Candidatus Woesearchaeota archaeon]|nr:hypothetical protein [Candidatus Woesearchaeota archaeon]
MEERKRTNIDIFESLICRSLSLGCYVEAISLIHNTIESYLKNVLRLKNEVKGYYLIDYAIDCERANLISKDLFNDIDEFNKNRNKAIHKLLKNEIDYKELMNVIFSGRKIQLGLSPCNHKKEEIERVLNIDKRAIKIVTTKEIMDFQNKRIEF